jgi:hypothetical protein
MGLRILALLLGLCSLAAIFVLINIDTIIGYLIPLAGILTSIWVFKHSKEEITQDDDILDDNFTINL